MSSINADALEYHDNGRPGKTEVVPTKPCLTARDLSLAYTPGVAAPCLEIERDPSLAYRFTNKGNLVAVVCSYRSVSGEVVSAGRVVPDDFLLIAEGERGHVAGNSRLCPPSAARSLSHYRERLG